MSTLIYASSFLISQAERSVVPTTPIYLWTIWFVYSLHLLLKGRRSGLILTAVLFSLVWHIQLVLGLLVFLSLAVILFFRKFRLSDFILPAVIGLVLSLPLLLFEARYNFSQTRALFGTFSSATGIVRSPLEKASHVFGIILKNANSVFWDRPTIVKPLVLPGILLASFWSLALFQPSLRSSGYIFTAWFFLLTIFFTRHPINVSEYYLDGLTLLWVLMAAFILARLGRLGWFLVLVIVFSNLVAFITSPPQQEGYLARSSLVDFIAADAKRQGYPCISVSFMTSPGYDLGYRFLFYRKNLHVNHPDSGAPVYTVVFPHTRANRLDFTFQALGLVLPEFNRYTDETVKASCSGQNSNLTDPMFGFTK